MCLRVPLHLVDEHLHQRRHRIPERDAVALHEIDPEGRIAPRAGRRQDHRAPAASRPKRS